MLIKRFKFTESEFLKNVSYQMVGTGLAQLLPFAATPILTRLYSETDFALYTSFFAIAGIFVVGAGARYQYAIVLPKDDNEALRIFMLSIYISIVYTILLFAFYGLFNNIIDHDLGKGVYFIPLYVFFFGVWTSFSNLSIRNKSFLKNAIAKVLQSISYILVAVGTGVLNFSFNGLIVAKIFGVLVSVAYLLNRSSVKINSSSVRTIYSFESLKGVAMKYKEYPKYGLIPAFLDIASVQGLILILTRFYSTTDLGYFGLTNLVLSAPLGLIGGSFKDVFYQRIASMIIRRDFENALRFFKKSALGLFLIGLPICIIIYFFGVDIFSFVFGKRWGRSGEFAAMLSASFLVQLVVSPLSSVFNAASKVKVASLWQTLYFISTFLTLGVSASVFELQVETLLFLYVIHEVILYSIYLLLQYWTLKQLR